MLCSHSPSHQKSNKKRLRAPRLEHVQVVDLSEGDEANKDVVEIDNPHNVEMGVIVYDPLIKKK